MKTLQPTGIIKWSSPVALISAFALYFITEPSLSGASPLALLLVAASGWLLHLKEPIGGNLLLFFGGSALLLFPFLYHASFGYAVLALPVAASGAKGLLQWWKA